jgi:hypothetical protein
VVLEDVRLLAVRGVVTEDGEPPHPVRVGVTAAVHRPGDRLYAPVRLDGRPDPVTAEPFDVTLLPYHLWANRTPGAMRVWLPVAPSPLHPDPRPR